MSCYRQVFRRTLASSSTGQSTGRIVPPVAADAGQSVVTLSLPPVTERASARRSAWRAVVSAFNWYHSTPVADDDLQVPSRVRQDQESVLVSRLSKSQPRWTDVKAKLTRSDRAGFDRTLWGVNE
jgi:hypothetical protein